MNFILVVAHVLGAIHLVCCKIQSKYCKCKLPLESFVGLDFVVDLVDKDASIINSLKAQYRKSCIQHIINSLLFVEIIDLSMDTYQAMKMLEKVGVSMSLLLPFINVRSTSVLSLVVH
jgi:hypothetical protein